MKYYFLFLILALVFGFKEYLIYGCIGFVVFGLVKHFYNSYILTKEKHDDLIKEWVEYNK